MKTILILFVSLMLMVNLSAGEQKKIVVDGSTTVGPIAKAFAEYYKTIDPSVNITVSESGSGNGAKSLMNGVCDVADMSRFMKGKEFKAAVAKGVSPVAHVVALDGIAIIVNPANSVSNLKVEQVRNIYLGKTKNWKELGGPDMPIVFISRDTNSGTFETFKKLVMKKQKLDSKVEVVGSNGAIRSRVQNTKGAIGYVGIGFLDRTVKGLKIDSVYPTARTIAEGKYPVARPLFMFTNGYPKMGSAVYRFINLYLTPKGQKIIKRIGFVPVTNYKTR